MHYLVKLKRQLLWEVQYLARYLVKCGMKTSAKCCILQRKCRGQILHLPRKIRFQHHQILCLPTFTLKPVMIDPHTLWHVILHCAEQEVSPSNLTTLMIDFVTYEASLTMRGARGVTLQPSPNSMLSLKMTLVIDPRHIWNVMYMAWSNRRRPPTSPNITSATLQHRQIAVPHVAPAAKSDTATSPNVAAATKSDPQHHQVLRLPLEGTLQTSPNAGPATNGTNATAATKSEMWVTCHVSLVGFLWVWWVMWVRR